MTALSDWLHLLSLGVGLFALFAAYMARRNARRVNAYAEEWKARYFELLRANIEQLRNRSGS